MSQWPSLVMPMGTTSYLSGSRPRITEAAEARETSCSPERPPKRTPMRNRFLSGVMEIVGFMVVQCQFLVIGQRWGVVAGEVGDACRSYNGALAHACGSREKHWRGPSMLPSSVRTSRVNKLVPYREIKKAAEPFLGFIVY